MGFLSPLRVRKLRPGLITSPSAWSFHETGNSLVRGRNPLSHGEPQKSDFVLAMVQNAERQLSRVHTSSLLHVKTE